ncbi:MAG: hypothetical protein RLP44_07515 [Aggregatilineales bacterium]
MTKILMALWSLLLLIGIAACGASTSNPPESLPLDATQPTLFYFYTDN